MLKDKVEYAKQIIAMIGEQYTKPIIYTNFGKDSMVVLHLCRSLGFNWPIMFHKEPEFPIKFQYAQNIIIDWNLTCHDYPPRICSVFAGENSFEVCTHYGIGGGHDMILCGVLYKPDEYIDGKYLCAYEDLYIQPKCHKYDFVWDVGIRGDRSVDANPHTGVSIRNRRDIIHNVGGADFAFPINHFTDEEVYQYTIQNMLPINDRVYDVVNGRFVVKDDKTFSPDHRPACWECMCPGGTAAVMCPKKGYLVNRLWDNLYKVLPSNPNEE